MTTTGFVLLICFYLITPVFIIWITGKVPLLNKAGSIVIAYLIGLIIGNIGIIGNEARELQDLMITITIPIALPLLLFSLQISKWTKLAGRTGLSLVVALSSLIIVVSLGHFLWKDNIEDSAKVAGMLFGVYSGGTPNLASIKTALSVDETTYILTHTYDIVLCAIYLFILITFGKVLLRRFLPRFINRDSGEEPVDSHLSTDDYSGMFKRKTFIPLMGALGITILIFAVGGGLSMIVDESVSMVTAILSITTFGIAASFIPRINRIKKTFELGMYFILVFSLVVASMANISNLKISSLYLFYFVALAVFGTLLLHVILARIFRIDADTTMITSIALVFSPPFVPMMAGALGNRQIIISGLAVGIIGYAIGNYLGVFMAMLLQG